VTKRSFVCVVSIIGWLWAAGASAAEVGMVLAATGEVTASGADAVPRALTKGSGVLSGDTVRTAAEAAVQIRFTDGALLSLRGATVYRVDEYAHAPGERGFFSLLKGGLRTLTGLIGRQDRAGYRVATPVATIGVRGTDYALRLCQDDCPPALANGLYLSVFQGAIVAVNDVGEYVIGEGESAFIPDRRSPLQSRDDISLGMSGLQPWRGAGAGTVMREAFANSLNLEYRAIDSVRCTNR